VDLAWEAPLYTSGPLLEYRVYRAADAEGPFAFVAGVPPDALSYTDSGDLFVTYHYLVTAVNEVGEGPVSDGACSKPFPWVSLEGDNLCDLPL
jgi:hypothetical protein